MSWYVHTIPLFLSLFFFHMVSSQLPSAQITTMNKLYGFLKNSTSPSFPWNSTQDPNPCSWKGVVCRPPSNSSITQLSLSSISLSNSSFLPVFCEIDSLEVLDLSNNHMSEIPGGFVEACGRISVLSVLNFSRNKLEGSLRNFSGFGVLEHLDFSHNMLSGNLDSQLDGLVRLKILNLSNNNFNGYVPKSLGSSTLLEELELSINKFQGQIPQEIANCGNLTLIDLSFNNLSGTIPQRLGELSKLSTLILSANLLTGEIPQSLSSINTLSRFAANQNAFTGLIPPGITRFLKNIDLSYNMLNGSIPLDFLTASNLQYVDLSNNELDGAIPENMSQSLIRLRLGSNSFNGRIPSLYLGNLQNLTYLELDGNKLTGPIPPQLGLCKKLALLNLANNLLTDVLPRELGNLNNVQVMKLQMNSLSGEIPIEITNLTRLQLLNISSNSLRGSIPPSISNLQNLDNLDLQRNHLSGPLPSTIGSLNSLLELQLANNQLEGVIISLPKYLQISLNLSNNLFNGSIPRSVSSLTGLEVLDLSNNRFSGEIPDFLTTMTGLTQLVLANNSLSGMIPKFQNFVTVDTSGNKDLINSTTTNTSPGFQRRKRTVAIGVVVGALAGVLALGIVVTIALTFSRRFYRVNDEHVEMGERGSPRPEVIEGVLLTSNGIHRSNIDFSTAMEAVTNHSNIFLKTRFSTYYKAIMPSGSRYIVKKLNWTDKIFQLGSHEKFGEELEVLGRLSNSSVMTPLAYVLTVDHAYLFYEFAEKGTLFDVLHGGGNGLDWSSRYSIAIGVAQGLAFLHGSPSGPILLLDLSSKSILLKSLKEPQVGDIELCKVIDPSKSTGSLSAVAGSVGYIPPEYAYTMRVTMAGNVYSFGVILLELVTGKAAVSEGIELAKWVLSKSTRKGNWDHILDYSVSRGSVSVRTQMLSVLRIALACVNVSPEARPKMKSVLRMLLNAR
ncbi:hypothetical protein LguiB_018133 [Lonicera macranthoides]